MNRNLKINYIAECDLNAKSAYVVHVIKMIDNLSKLSKNVCLFVPNSKNTLLYLKYHYAVKLRKCKIFSIINRPISSFFLRIIFCLFSSFKVKKNSLIITRSFWSSIFLTILRKKHYLEIHNEVQGLTRFFLINLGFIYSKKIIKIIFISKALSKIYKLNKEVLILHDAVDIEHFKFKPKNYKKIFSVGYIGSFYSGRGIEKILTMSSKLKKYQFKLYGADKNFNRKQSLNNNVEIYDKIPHRLVPKIISRLDVLLMPFEKKISINAKNINTSKYMSPMKMFEYLSSGRVILSSNIGVLKEVLISNFNCIIVKDNKVETWVKELDLLKNNIKLMNKISKNAINTARRYTWYLRSKTIVDDFIIYKFNDKNWNS